MPLQLAADPLSPARIDAGSDPAMPAKPPPLRAEQATDVLFMLDAQARLAFVSPSVTELLGYTPAELLGQSFATLVQEDDLARAAKWLTGIAEASAQGGFKVDLLLRSKSGKSPRIFSVELFPAPALAGSADTPAQPLPAAFSYGVARDVSRQRRDEARIRFQTYHDGLTALPNRILFRQRLQEALESSRQDGSLAAVLVLDLDRFKSVNDSLGHAAGDELLRAVAQRFRSCLRSCDTLSRLGGNEFAIVLPKLGEAASATTVAQKILAKLQQPFHVSRQALYLSASIGLALYPADGKTESELTRNADLAMYETKANGKNGYRFFTRALLYMGVRRVRLEHDMHEALQGGQFAVHYQPQIHIKSRSIVGAEALIRWNHPEHGLLNSCEFLSIAEETGLIVPLTDWMLRVVCADLLAWDHISAFPLKLSVNLSPCYLERSDFHARLRDTIAEFGVQPSQIEVEVTENVFIRKPERAHAQLAALQAMGVVVAFDDFGTGYSSLAYLQMYPVQTLKIDRVFVNTIQDLVSPQPVVQAILAIARGLNLKVVAEGVETQIQADYLHSAGCEVVQGFLYFRPAPQAVMLQLLQQESRIDFAGHPVLPEGSLQ